MDEELCETLMAKLKENLIQYVHSLKESPREALIWIVNSSGLFPIEDDNTVFPDCMDWEYREIGSLLASIDVHRLHPRLQHWYHLGRSLYLLRRSHHVRARKCFVKAMKCRIDPGPFCVGRTLYMFVGYKMGVFNSSLIPIVELTKSPWEHILSLKIWFAQGNCSELARKCVNVGFGEPEYDNFSQLEKHFVDLAGVIAQIGLGNFTAAHILFDSCFWQWKNSSLISPMFVFCARQLHHADYDNLYKAMNLTVKCGFLTDIMEQYRGYICFHHCEYVQAIAHLNHSLYLAQSFQVQMKMSNCFYRLRLYRKALSNFLIAQKLKKHVYVSDRFRSNEREEVVPILMRTQMTKVCAWCGDNGHEKLYPCSGCWNVSYCNRKCQKKRWKFGHRTECDKTKSPLKRLMLGKWWEE